MTAVANEYEQKRSAKRYDLHIEVEYDLGDGTKKIALTRNISLGGCYIDAPDRPAMGARCQLRFKVPTQKESVEVGAIVRWTDPSGFGVQFDGLRARDVWALSKWFEQPQPR
jgi:hypothetical protein